MSGVVLRLSRRTCQVHATHVPRIDRAGGWFTTHKHHIQPLALGGPDVASNWVQVCPTGHDAIHELLRAWIKADGEPVWEIRRYYHPEERWLAKQGFSLWLAAGRPGRDNPAAAYFLPAEDDAA